MMVAARSAPSSGSLQLGSVIGHWPLGFAHCPRLFAKGFANNPGQGADWAVMAIDQFFFYLALLGYLLGTLHYLLHIPSRRLSIGRAATYATLAGFGAHTLSHIFRIYALRRPPLGSLYESLSFFAWAIVLIYLITEFRYGNRVIGAFVLPMVVLAGSAAAALPSRIAELGPTLQGVGLWIHVALAIFGNAAFALTFCTGLMYLLQERQLKSRHSGKKHLP